MREQIREEPEILAAAERQMLLWAKANESAVPFDDSVSISSRLKPYIAISREAGAGGSPVGRIVGKMLGWEVLDRNILDRVAQRSNLSRSVLETVDETQSNWVTSVLSSWLDPNMIPHEKYVVHLSNLILATACQAPAVYVGRGVQFILPKDLGLSVRIIASERYRIQRIADRENLSSKEARTKMLELDNGRRAFVSQFFHHNIEDPHIYDLVLNVERLGDVPTAECIAAAFTRLGDRTSNR